MNILKTFQQLEAATEKRFWEINVPKMSRNIERLQIKVKSFENAYRSAFFGPESAALWKNKLHYKYFSINLFTF